MSHPRFRKAQRPVAPAPAPRICSWLVARKPRPRLRPHLRPRPHRRPQRRPLPLRSTRSAPTPTPDAGQQAASPPAPAPPPSAPGSARRRPVASARSAPLAEAAPAAARARTGGAQVAGVFAPKNLAQLVGAWAYSEGDCERLFQRRGGGWAFRQPVDKFAQAAIVELPKKILLPSATCRIDRASEADGALKVSAECASSISYTPRSVIIALRSPTELVYSATGDPALATTLKKCAP